MKNQGVILLAAIAAATLAILFGRKENRATKPTTNGTNHDVPASDSSSAAHLEEVALVKVFEVFLSFCGKDTRNGFTDFLFLDLKHASIETFKDDNELRVGEKIGPALLTAIRESKISIPVFSKNYAFSKWCLLELEEMVDCHKNGGHMIYPIFYDLAPFEVRHQYGSYEKAFQEHEKKFDKETVERWREALRIVGDLKGLELKKETNGQQGKLAKMMVEKVLVYLKKNYTVLPENLVGIDTHLEKFKELLHFDFGGARVVVIHGMGGLGKTTIAKAAFNQLHERFDNHCFLDDVREKLEHRDGIIDLQNHLISKIRNREFSKIIFDANEGRDTIKGTVCGRKVLLVLDDVDNISQVKMLMGNLSWYGVESRIIITTRDTYVLCAIERTCQIEGLNDVCSGYKPSYMDDHDSLHLFSQYAFMRDCPAEGYERLSEEVIGIAAGLPLVLVVLGSAFFVADDKDFWKEKLRKLRELPNEEVIDKLRFSFDALGYTEKQIFLDIACLFIGEDVTMPSYMWDDCGFYPRDGINVLVRKSLITVDEHNRFEMHDQLRDLGRQIVREESLNELGKQSRFWRTEEAMHMLETNQGTTSVNVLRLPSSSETFSVEIPESEGESPVLASSFNNIPNIRYLHMGCKYLDGDFKDLLLGLRWLTISNFREGLPTNLHLKHLVILNLACNDLRDFKIGEKLKVLVLTNCRSVRVLSDLSKHPSLEILSLSGCDSLCAIDGLEKLKSLKCLKAYNCHSLEKVCLSGLTNLCKLELRSCDQLTEILGLEKLESLQELCISVCPSLEELPDLSNLKRLEKIYVYWNENLIKIKGLRKLESLRCLTILDCECLEMFPDFSNLKMLENIRVRGCSKLIEIKGLEKLVLIKNLCLQNCKSLERLPDLSNLKKLKTIDVTRCVKLVKIEGLEKLELLEDLCLENCISLERLPDFSNLKKLKKIKANGCTRLVEIKGLDKLESLRFLELRECRSLKGTIYMSNLDTFEVFHVPTLELTNFDFLKKLKELEITLEENLLKFEGLDVNNQYISGESMIRLLIDEIQDLIRLESLVKMVIHTYREVTEIQALDRPEFLRLLDKNYCSHFKRVLNLPNFGTLKSIELRSCDELDDVEGIGVIESLESLGIIRCYKIRQIPDLRKLKTLKSLYLADLNLISIHGLDELKSIESLYICRCPLIENLPDLSKLVKLAELNASGCERLTEIQGLEKMKSLTSLNIKECKSIVVLPDFSDLEQLVELDASGCVRLSKITGLEELTSLERLNIVGCESIEALPDLTIRSLLGLPNTIVQQTHNIHEDTEDFGPSYETSETSTNSMTDIEDHDPLTCLVDPLNTVYEQGETSSSMPELKGNSPQTSLGLGLASSSEEIPNQDMPQNTSKKRRL